MRASYVHSPASYAGLQRPFLRDTIPRWFSSCILATLLSPLAAFIRPRVRHVVYCPKCHLGISAAPPRPRALNAGVAHSHLAGLVLCDIPQSQEYVPFKER